MKSLLSCALLLTSTTVIAGSITAIPVFTTPPFKVGKNIIFAVTGTDNCGIVINNGAGQIWDTALTDPSTPPSKTLTVNYAQPGTYLLTAGAKAPCTGMVQTSINVIADPVVLGNITAINITTAPPFKTGQNISIVVKGDNKCSTTIDNGAGQSWVTLLTDPTTPPSKALAVKYTQPGTYVLSATGKDNCGGKAEVSLNVIADPAAPAAPVVTDNPGTGNKPPSTEPKPTTPKSPCDSPTANCRPDLAILSAGEELLSKNVWSVTVKNQGLKGASAYRLEFEATLLLADKSKKKITRVVDMSPLKVGDKVKWSFDLNKDLPPNSRVSGAVYRADVTNMVPESNETNNTATVGAGAKFDPNA